MGALVFGPGAGKTVSGNVRIFEKFMNHVGAAAVFPPTLPHALLRMEAFQNSEGSSCNQSLSCIGEVGAQTHSH